MLSSAVRAALEFVDRLQEPTTQPLIRITLFFCFAPVRETVVSQAKLHVLTSFGMPERPNERSCDISPSLKRETSVFEAQYWLIPIASANKLSTVNF